jgi:hypothetical protein
MWRADVPRREACFAAYILHYRKRMSCKLAANSEPIWRGSAVDFLGRAKRDRAIFFLKSEKPDLEGFQVGSVGGGVVVTGASG